MAKIKRSGTDHKTKPKNINKRAFERVYWPYIPIIIAISLLLGVSINSGNLEAYMRHPGGRVLAYSTSMSIGGLLADTNNSRAANGVASLSLNAKLDAAAQACADDMAARDYWSHYTPEGNPPWIWVSAQGYAYQKLGQNLATGFSDEQATIDGWMNSPPHRENLLDPSFTEVGFGYANNPNYTAAGGGPMTIVVAFYGQPQVLAANTPAATAPTSTPSQSTPAASTPVSQPQQTTPAATQPPPAKQETKTKSQPAATSTPKSSLPAPVTQTRLQIALANSKLAPAAGGAIFLALVLLAFWAARHMRAIHRFFIKGESYAIRHPLTDLGLLIIAGLLFILSQTAGLIQ
jgi:hypothetical protein